MSRDASRDGLSLLIWDNQVYIDPRYLVLLLDGVHLGLLELS